MSCWSVVGLWFFVVLSREVVVGDFITWDDMTLDERMVNMDNNRNDMNRSKVLVVDQRGGGDSTTVQGAVDMVPVHNSQRVKICIHPGIYREKVFIPASKPYISFIGNEDQPSNTVITWNNKASDINKDGTEVGTYRSASVAVESDYFCASGITFQNSVIAVPGGDGMQAVALRISGDKAVFYKVRILGTQDTLLDDSGSHYFYQSYIQGSIDFIFGQARSLYKNCTICSVASPVGSIAAHHRESLNEDTGFSFVDCKINGTGTVYLGRAWGHASRVVYSFCDLGGIINPVGWSDWNDPSRQKTIEFGEYQCTGKGADRSQRVPWSKSYDAQEAEPFLEMDFIGGEQWLRL